MRDPKIGPVLCGSFLPVSPSCPTYLDHPFQVQIKAWTILHYLYIVIDSKQPFCYRCHCLTNYSSQSLSVIAKRQNKITEFGWKCQPTWIRIWANLNCKTSRNLQKRYSSLPISLFTASILCFDRCYKKRASSVILSAKVFNNFCSNFNVYSHINSSTDQHGSTWKLNWLTMYTYWNKSRLFPDWRVWLVLMAL